MRDALRGVIGKPVVVQLDECSVSGTLAAISRDSLLIESPRVADDKGVEATADGALHIERLRVLWVQVL